MGRNYRCDKQHSIHVMCLSMLVISLIHHTAPFFKVLGSRDLWLQLDSVEQDAFGVYYVEVVLKARILLPWHSGDIHNRSSFRFGLCIGDGAIWEMIVCSCRIWHCGCSCFVVRALEPAWFTVISVFP